MARARREGEEAQRRKRTVARYRASEEGELSQHGLSCLLPSCQIDIRGLAYHGGRTEHNTTVPEHKCREEAHHCNVSPYLPCDREWVTDDCNGDADNAIKRIYTKRRVRAESTTRNCRNGELCDSN